MDLIYQFIVTKFITIVDGNKLRYGCKLYPVFFT